MSNPPPSRDPWPHAPPHWLFLPGFYFVTASTYQRQPLFDTASKLDVVTRLLVQTAEHHGWSLRAWAVLANHYHFLAQSPEATGASLRDWLKNFHWESAIRVNALSARPGRRVWMNYRETHITHQTSYLARLRYINENPVHHRLVPEASLYPWCSAAWFRDHASKSFIESVGRFKIDRLNVWEPYDDQGESKSDTSSSEMDQHP